MSGHTAAQAPPLPPHTHTQRTTASSTLQLCQSLECCPDDQLVVKCKGGQGSNVKPLRVGCIILAEWSKSRAGKRCEVQGLALGAALPPSMPKADCGAMPGCDAMDRACSWIRW